MRGWVALVIGLALHAAALAGEHVLEGVVRDVDGRPVPGATVRLGDVYAESRSRTAIADGAGRYRIDGLDEGVQQVRAAPPGQPPPLAAVRVRVASISRFDPVLLPGHLVRGRVKTADGGEPLAGALVVVRGEGYWGAFHGLATSGADGTYTLTTPARGFRLYARALLDGRRMAGEEPSYAPELDEDVVLDIALERRPAGTLRGFVRDAAGAPLEGVEVLATNVRRSGERTRALLEHRAQDPGYWSVRTSADGGYVLEGVDAGVVNLTARAPGRYLEGDDGRFFAPGGSEELPGPVHVLVPDRDAITTDLVLRPKVTVRGVVVDQYAIPVAGATVAVPANVVPLDRAETDEHGAWELPVAPGSDVRIFASAPGHEAAFAVLSAVPDGASPEGPLELVVRRRTAVSVHARSVDGEPVPGARAAVVPDGLPVVAAAGEVRTWTELDAAGNGELSLRPGDVEVAVVVAAAGFAPCVCSGVGELADVQVELLPGHALRGRVLDAGGAPLAGLRVTLEPRAAGWSAHPPDVQAFGRAVWAVSDDDGRFEIADLPEGTHGVVVSGAGFFSAAADVTLPADEEEVVLRPERALPIAGVVVDDAGQPVARARIDARDPQSREVMPQSTGDGRFRLWWMTPGEHVLDVEPPSDAWMRSRVEGVAGGASDVRIVLARRHPVTGRVLAADGAALPGVRVVLSRIVDGTARRLEELATDEAGAFAFGRQDPGDYVLSAIPLSGGWAPLHRHVRPAADETYALRVVQGARVAGVLLDGDDRPAAGRTLVVRLIDPPPDAPGWMRDERLRVTTDASGAFELGGLTPGRVMASLEPLPDPAADFVLADGREVELTAGTEDATLRGTWGTTVTGTVVDDAGNPLAGATVSLRAGAVDRETTTAASGAFTLSNLPADSLRYAPMVRLDGWQTVRTEPGRGTAGVPFLVTMVPAVDVRGMLVDAAGAPLAGWRIELRHDEHAWQTGVASSKSGRFLVRGAPEGVLICRARSPDGGAWSPCGRFSTNVEDPLLRLGDE